MSRCVTRLLACRNLSRVATFAWRDLEPGHNADPPRPFAQALLNPFHELNAPLRSPVFDQRVKASARKHL